MTASGGAEGRRASGQRGSRHFVSWASARSTTCFTQTLLATASADPGDQSNERGCWRCRRGMARLHGARWAGSWPRSSAKCGGLRGVSLLSARRCARAGVLIVGSTLFIWSLVFITGIGHMRHRGRLLQPIHRHGPPTRGVFAAWCNFARGRSLCIRLHDVGRRSGTGHRRRARRDAHLLRRIDALQVMGINSIDVPVCDRVCSPPGSCLPFMYIGADRRRLPCVVARRRANSLDSCPRAATS